MSRKCTVCGHDESFAINEAIIVESQSNRATARQYNVSKDAIQRHKAHIPKLLLKATEDQEMYDTAAILRKIRDLEEATLEQLEGAKDDEDRRYTLAAIREQRGNLELAAKVAKLISDAPVVNIVNSPQYIQLQAVVVEALEGYPEARESVVRALGEVRDG